MIKGEERDWRTWFLAEYFAEPRYPRIPTWQAVWTSRWMYIHYPELAGMEELYDLRANLYEMKNLVQESSAQAALEEMKAERERFLQ